MSLRGVRVFFFFDLASPYAWLVAEQIGCSFDCAVDWLPAYEPVLERASGRSSVFSSGVRRRAMAEIEEGAQVLGLPPVNWPHPFPVDSARVMKVASHARSVGRLEQFALAAFRHQFLAGQPLSEWYAIADVVSQIDMDAVRALDSPLDLRTKSRLNASTAFAVGKRVPGVPAITVGDRVFWGLDGLPSAAAEARSRYLSQEKGG